MEAVEAPNLSKELRSAFEEAARDERLWEQAKADPEAFVRERGVPSLDGFTVAFLDVEREGDRIRYLGAGNELVLDMICPPGRVWWQQCRKVIRVCETRDVLVDGELVTVETNCYLVCEQWIWEESFTLPTRPPFPPLPRP